MYVIPLCVFEIGIFEITLTSPTGQLINASRNTSLGHRRSIGNNRERVDKMDAMYPAPKMYSVHLWDLKY